MVLAVSIFAAMFWFIVVALILYSKSSPEAQVRRRLQIMIDNAEELRIKNRANDTKKIAVQVEPTQAEKIKMFWQKSFYERMIQPIFDKFSDSVQNLAPVQIKELFERQIFLAGKQGVWNVKRIVLFWLISIAAGLAVGFFITQNVFYHFLQETMILILSGAVGAVLPVLRLQAIIRDRKKKIRRQLPEFLDLLCVSVQAGLSFDGAVAKITSRMKGAIIDEFKRFQNDISLGMTRQYSLTQMAKRCDLEEIYLFTTSVIQAEKLGTSMSRTLKLQSDNIRDRHRQWVKAQALKAPVKIIFPMVFFIFPSIFVVLLFPALITIIKTLGNQ